MDHDYYLFVGLGNPGWRYRKTRHNIGFMVLEAICKTYKSSFKRLDINSKIAQINIYDKNILLLKPQTFMNNSGIAVQELVENYMITPERLVVIYDDTSIDFGQLRFRGKGSAGGHNGLQSIITHLGTEKFCRLRVGIGSNFDKGNLVKYVLSNFDKHEKKELKNIIHTSLNALESFVQHGLNKTMNQFNTKNTAK